MSCEKAVVIRNRSVGRDLYELDCIAPRIVPTCRPGQFVHVRVGSTSAPLLRRPLSLYDVDAHRAALSLLYKVKGSGTALLSQIRPREHLDVMGPLGRGFSSPVAAGSVLLVGGGVGIAPLVYLARTLKPGGCRITALYGAGSADELAAADRLEALADLCLTATLDGSLGHRGLVTDLLASIDPGRVDFVYTCGPEPMMAAVADWARANDVRGEASLEANMACGVGACLGCACETVAAEPDGYAKVCIDGPVFPLHSIRFRGKEGGSCR